MLASTIQKYRFRQHAHFAFILKSLLGRGGPLCSPKIHLLQKESRATIVNFFGFDSLSYTSSGISTLEVHGWRASCADTCEEACSKGLAHPSTQSASTRWVSFSESTTGVAWMFWVIIE